MTSHTHTGTVQVDSQRYPARHNRREMEWQIAGQWLPVLDDEIARTFRTDAELAMELRFAEPVLEGTVTMKDGSTRQAWAKQGSTVVTYCTRGGLFQEMSAATFTPAT